MHFSPVIEQLFFFLSLISLAVLAVSALEFAVGSRSVEFLKDIPPLNPARAPRVSVIVAARNEEKNIEQALQSVLDQDYPNMEVLVVDDRSTDSTGAVLDRMAQQSEKLRVFHVSSLPEDWLGKNHALYFGSLQSKASFFLFTDADIVMDRSAVSRAMSYMLDHSLDHLTITPEPKMSSGLLSMLAGYITISLGLFGKPWKAREPGSRYYVGIGAFNLLRADAYREIGSHRAIAMRPDDDIKLGKLVKLRGFRQEVLYGKSMLSVEWYSSLKEMIVGLTKNCFAAVDYNLPIVILATIPYLLLTVWPFLGALLTSGFTQLMNVIIALILIYLYGDNSRYFGIKSWYGIGFPLAAFFLIYILWRSTLSTLINNGIDWRGTHYPLDKMKANKI